MTDVEFESLLMMQLQKVGQILELARSGSLVFRQPQYCTGDSCGILLATRSGEEQKFGESTRRLAVMENSQEYRIEESV